jgi:hypothetical protein
MPTAHWSLCTAVRFKIVTALTRPAADLTKKFVKFWPKESILLINT